MNTPVAKTVVLGLGNILHSDDGVGPRAVVRLKEDGRMLKDVSLIEGGTLGLELLGYLWDTSYLLLLDAVDAGQPAGTLIRMSGEELHKVPGNGSVHQLGVADLLAGLRMLARRPPEVVLLGVQPATTDWGTTLSPAVEAALSPLVEAAFEELYRSSRTEVGTEA
jgi:hydrogenase maturation protease